MRLTLICDGRTFYPDTFPCLSMLFIICQKNLKNMFTFFRLKIVLTCTYMFKVLLVVMIPSVHTGSEMIVIRVATEIIIINES